MSTVPDRPMTGAPDAPPLFLPHVPFPPYRFVPGVTPHPFNQAGGYAFGQRPPAPPFLPRDQWRENEPYLRGLDFFNRGWWWEAHESWESLWHVVQGRDEAQHELLKGLIQLAACALNRERGHDEGAARLLDTALAALSRAETAASAAALCGLDLNAVASDARRALGAPCPRVTGLYLRPR
jgi:hypothetical protein